MDKKIVFFLVITIVSLVLAGCWDKVEINERAFVTAMGIDKHIGTDKGDRKAEEESGVKGINRYNITYNFPNIAAKGKQGQGEPRFLVESVGISPYLTTRKLRTRLHQIMFFEHMKVLVIGDEVAKNADMLKETLDSVERSNKVNRKVNVLVSKGKAKDILNIESQFEADLGFYISNIEEASEGTGRFNPLKLGDLLESLHSNKNALMPRVIPGEKDVKLAGSAIIKNYELVGYLGEIENRSAMFLKDTFRSDAIVVIDEKEKVIIPYTITHSTTRRKASIKDGNIKFQYLIDMEGDLNQAKLDTVKSVLDDKYLKKIEKMIEAHIKDQIMKTVEKLQKEFKVDVIGVGDYLSKFKPDIWKDVKDEWEMMFQDVDIDVIIDAKIRRIGLTE